MILAALAAALAALTPDYTGLTVPPNIAPLNFDLDRAERVTLVSSAGDRLEKSGREIRFGPEEWRRFLQRARGGHYILTAGELVATNRIAREDIDPYLTYRLTVPTYTAFDDMCLAERSLEDATERILYSTRQTSRRQCVNCHTPCNGDPNTTLFHKRYVEPCTVIASPKYGLSAHRIKMQDGFKGSAVYPAWHPSGDYIAFTMNETRQCFFLTDPTKIEVSDLQSDLTLYSLADRRLTTVEDDPQVFSCFPTWSPDGKCLYTVQATVDFPIDVGDEQHRATDIFTNLLEKAASSIRYDLAVRHFDIANQTFTPPQILIKAREIGSSVLFPRVSPDGRYIVVTLTAYGGFSIWHRESDLAILDLATGRLRTCAEINSGRPDSYHSFSSNGRWMVFSSRRQNGVYTRPYFTYFNPETGRFTKPFLLPVTRPAEHDERFYSYNIPEFLKGRTPHSPAQLRRVR